MTPDTVRPTIAFDVTHANDKRRTGIGRAVEEFIRSAVWLHAKGEWSFGKLILVSAWPFRLPRTLMEELWGHRIDTVVLPFKSMYLYRALRLPLWTLAKRPDLLFVPEPIHPGLIRGAPMAVMHYDLIARQSPATVSRHIRLLYRLFLLRTLRTACRVGVDSEFVRSQTGELLSGFMEKSEVLPIYLHEADRFDPVSPEGLDPGTPFSLFIGNLLPHKNVRRLVEAFVRWKRTAPEEFHPLYIVGRPRPEVDDIAPHLQQLEQEGIVKHFGYIHDEHLSWLYANARFLAFPSLIEGCGLPILEAMSRGCPVLTAAGGATEETAGGAALLVDPRSAESILEGIRQIATDEELRNDLSRRGLAHASTFTRERHAIAFRDFLGSALQ